VGERIKLQSLYISGFKSFAFLESPSDPRSAAQTIAFGDVTVLLGANGAGKSSVIGAIQLLTEFYAGRSDDFVARHGGARSLLHYGPAKTTRLEVRITIRTEAGSGTDAVHLVAAAADTFVLGASGGSTGAFPVPDIRRLAQDAIRRTRIFQFHDTTPNARIRGNSYVQDADELRRDGANLAAFLHALAVRHPEHYARIRETIQQTFPAFDDFDLRPSPLDPNSILLNWRVKGQPDYLFGPHQISDGTLRFMALATLLLQPHDRLPGLIVVDEPELGLHPSALATLAGLVKQASLHAQVVLATQSPTLVDHFEPEHLRVIQQERGASRFLQLDPAELGQWLESYSLGEIWQKNLLQDGPGHA
jgi:predicted ATPase